MLGISFIRTVILYILIILAMRIMGKRTIGEMHSTELVVSIMISDLATVPMQSKSTPLLDGIIPIFTLVILELIFAYLILKSRVIRRILVGKSCSVVKGGKLMEKDMANLRVTVDDIEEQIRIGGYTSLDEVSEVTIETNGQVSILPKGKSRGVTVEDIKITPKAVETPYLIIVDGRVRKKDMVNARIGMNEVMRELKKKGITTVEEVLYMSAVNSHVVHLQRRGERSNA